ncbi:YciI family protein [Gilvimarinus sp. SDUM040013]|uniref:YciI family protein n=1 Tax=Gilvimarinus gilvus TaxID=3058038 RepID=A0ABU4S028_9GAMM|nr:YciI family protein [Gilvimarinus sp. SDUM040013]MDO3386229.1 YciI family protein [Gilvimarinus sp. SDUM040013]MDX6849776.1 YciI family protein [Gilvimarinus sp. SDUM040013]
MSQKKYMCVLRSDSGGCEKSEEQPSVTDMEAMYAKYQAWQQKFADRIVDMGSGLASGGSVVSKAGVKDGPFVEIKEIIGGYMIVAGDSIEQAVEVIQAGPMIDNLGVSIEIREITQV